VTFEELMDAFGRWDGPWEHDGTRSAGWTSGQCRHVMDFLTPVPLPDITEVMSVREYAATKDDWDGVSVAVLKLTRGRWMTWESWWGPTGDGFSEDAYGGDADVWISDTLELAYRLGLTDAGRSMLKRLP